jgi:RNA polymerase sigma factor (sigma-70 family)
VGICHRGTETQRKAALIFVFLRASASLWLFILSDLAGRRRYTFKRMTSDLDLLRQFTQENSQDAFTEIVRRHVNLVYSAALRQVRSPQLAEEIAQSVFADLARAAGKLKPDTILIAWLYAVTRRTAIDVIRKESRRQLREQIAVEMNNMNATAKDWTQIEPLLDDAMAALDETDRSAILLRYFENKNLREIGANLKISDDAAQKRISRALERLREFFSKRNVAIGASGLAVLISANAVQAAPVGLVATISSTVALAGTAVSTSTIIAATKTIAMTTLQKTFITAALTAAIGTGIFEAHQVSQLHKQNQILQQQETPLAEQIQQLRQELNDATNQLVALGAENEQLKSNPNETELLKLRGEVTQLRMAQQLLTQSKNPAVDMNDPAMQHFLAAKAAATEINKYLDQMPDKKIPELKLLTDVDWLNAANEAKFDTDADIRKTLSKLRSLAKNRMPMGRSLYAFTSANNGQLPTDISQLKPYFQSNLDSALGAAPLDDATLDAIFARYTLLHTGNLSDFPQGTWFIVEKAPVDKDYDSRQKIGNGTSTTISTGIGETGDPDDPSY